MDVNSPPSAHVAAPGTERPRRCTTCGKAERAEREAGTGWAAIERATPKAASGPLS